MHVIYVLLGSPDYSVEKLGVRSLEARLFKAIPEGIKKLLPHTVLELCRAEYAECCSLSICAEISAIS